MAGAKRGAEVRLARSRAPRRGATTPPNGELGRKLRHFNYGFVGEYLEQQYIRPNASDGNGRLLGGLRSFGPLGWCWPSSERPDPVGASPALLPLPITRPRPLQDS